MKTMHDAFNRANLYVSLHLMLSSLAENKEPPEEVKAFLDSCGVEVPRISGSSSRYLANLSATELRRDLTPIAREHLSTHIKAFIEQAGYIPPEPADKLLHMTAFAARLAIDACNKYSLEQEQARKLEKTLLRFVQTHFLPSLENANPPEDLKNLFQLLIRIVRIDRASLLSKHVVTGIKTEDAYSVY